MFNELKTIVHIYWYAEMLFLALVTSLAQVAEAQLESFCPHKLGMQRLVAVGDKCWVVFGPGTIFSGPWKILFFFSAVVRIEIWYFWCPL